MRRTPRLFLCLAGFLIHGCATAPKAAVEKANARPVAPFPIQPMASDWSAAPELKLQSKTPGDFVATVQLKYDDSAFYIRYVAKDDSVKTAPATAVHGLSSDLFQFDSLEFWINRHQFTIAKIDEKVRAYDYLRAAFMPGAKIESIDVKGGYGFVARLPWDELEFKASPGAMFQLAVQINDVDEKDGKRTRNTYSNPETVDWGNPLTFGSVFLNDGVPLDRCAKNLSPLLTPKMEVGAFVTKENLTLVPNPAYAEMDVRLDFDSKSQTAHLGNDSVAIDLPPAAKAGIRTVNVFSKMNGKTFGPLTFEYFSPGGKLLSEYRGSLEAPADFDAFWDQKLKELAAVPMNAKVEKVDHPSTVADVFQVTLTGWRDVKFIAYISVPKAEGKYPLNLWVYPADALDVKQMDARGDLVQLIINPRGVGTSAQFSPPPKNLYVDDVTDPSEFYLLWNILDDVRAIDYAMTLPKVDPKNVWVAGGSRGGYLSLAIAAIDNKRVTFCSSVSPCYSDVDVMGRLGWGSAANDAYLAMYGGPASRQESMRKIWGYFDTVTLAHRVKCPIVVETGMLDNICAAPGIVDAFNRIPGNEKVLIINPEGGHGGLGVGEQVARAVRAGYKIQN